MAVQVTRGDGSMGLFLTAAGVLSAVLFSICSFYDMPSRYRALWGIFDTVLMLWLCLANGWFKNKLRTGFNWLARRERA